jgi:adenylate kinase
MLSIIPSEAILLVGPTGAGKSPLGDWLQQEGLIGRSCHHFDFGANLRDVAGGIASGFEAAEVRFIRDVLEKGGLLENESFGLAMRILERFIALRAVRHEDLLVMNGLPRHVGQARAIALYLRFLAIIELQCSPDTIRARLQLNAGGDRAERTDDDPGFVRMKLELFEERTRPMLEYYREYGVPIIPVTVTAQTLPQDIVPDLRPIKAWPKDCRS